MPLHPFAWLSILGTLVLTSACASVEPVSKAPARAAIAAPQPVAGYDWHLTTDEGFARLAYGIAESDDLRLGLDCAAGSSRVDITATAPMGARTLLLESGGETERFAAEGEPSQLSDDDLLTASAAAEIPVFQSFRRLGWIAQWTGSDSRETYVAHPESRADIERFFALCD
ncbi:hypothetical protein [Brevundimonas subvibrioides]|uniref:hypothetical protein n=1 Tax=Brevundimonas subvibrioides TaxID=74313 RepID=UPI0022B408E8|nr:hypothetical protein [Brevundimonas subvibrioides]